MNANTKKNRSLQSPSLSDHSYPLSSLSDSNDCTEEKSRKDKTTSTTKHSKSHKLNDHTIPPFILTPELLHSHAISFFPPASADPPVLY